MKQKEDLVGYVLTLIVVTTLIGAGVFILLDKLLPNSRTEVQPTGVEYFHDLPKDNWYSHTRYEIEVSETYGARFYVWVKKRATGEIIFSGYIPHEQGVEGRKLMLEAIAGSTNEQNNIR